MENSIEELKDKVEEIFQQIMGKEIEKFLKVKKNYSKESNMQTGVPEKRKEAK